MLIPNPGNVPIGQAKDAVLVRSLQTWADDDLMLAIGAAAKILASRHRMTEGRMMRQLTELAELQDSAEADARRRASRQ